MRESAHKRPVQTLNGQCLACGYWFAWIVISGKIGRDNEVANDGKGRKVSLEDIERMH